jgi:polyhydroxyalkanoate synthesis regulator phasin
VRDDLRRMALFTSGIVEMTRNRAEELVKEWVKNPDVGREHAQSLVKDLMEWSRANRKELSSFVRTEVSHQLSLLGVVTRQDLERLESRVQRLEDASRSAAAASSRRTSARKTTARKATARKTRAASPRKKTSARRTASATGRRRRGTT